MEVHRTRKSKIPTMMLPSEQNPGEYEEHFVVQDPEDLYRRAVVKQRSPLPQA